MKRHKARVISYKHKGGFKVMGNWGTRQEAILTPIQK